MMFNLFNVPWCKNVHGDAWVVVLTDLQIILISDLFYILAVLKVVYYRLQVTLKYNNNNLYVALTQPFCYKPA